MACVRVIKDVGKLSKIYEINGIEVYLSWKYKTVSINPHLLTIEGIKKFVDNIELALNKKDIKLFKSLIFDGFVRTNIVKISETIFFDEFSIFLKEVCVELYQNDKIVSYSTLCVYLFGREIRDRNNNKNNFILSIVQFYQNHLVYSMKNALSGFSVNRVIKIFRAIPNYDRVNVFCSVLQEYSTKYLLHLGKIYIDKHKSFSRNKFGEYALGFCSLCSSPNKQIKSFMVPIFKELDSYLVETLKNYRYSFSDDVWLLIDMNIEAPLKHNLDWSSFYGIVKVEVKQYVHSYFLLGESVLNLKRRYINLLKLGFVLRNIRFESTDSILNITPFQVQQMIEILQQQKSKNRDHKYNIKTIQSSISECRLFYDWIAKNKGCQKFNNPFREIIMHNVEAFTESASYIPEEVIAEVQKKIHELPKYVQAAWITMMNTGMRISEVLNLEYDCLKYDSKNNLYYINFIPYKTLKFRRKHGLEDYHSLPINDDSLVFLLKQQIASSDALREISGENRIFLRSIDNRVRLFNSREISDKINYLISKYCICDQHGVLWKYTNHQCRKTVAVSMFTNGATVDEVSDWLSHLDDKATMKNYHDVELKKIAQMDFEYFELMFGNLDSDIKDSYSSMEIEGLKEEILLGARSTPEGHGICVKHVSFGPCMKKKCVGCKMMITGPQKLSMWKKLYEEQQQYINEWINTMESNGVNNWKDYREYHSEINLLDTYKETIFKLETFIKERLSEDEQKLYNDN